MRREVNSKGNVDVNITLQSLSFTVTASTFSSQLIARTGTLIGKLTVTSYLIRGNHGDPSLMKERFVERSRGGAPT
jgi:hypothetical protein